MKWSWVDNCSLDYSLHYPGIWKFLLIKRTERKYFHTILFYCVPIISPTGGKPPFQLYSQEMIDGHLYVYCLQFEEIKSFTFKKKKRLKIPWTSPSIFSKHFFCLNYNLSKRRRSFLMLFSFTKTSVGFLL